MDQRVSDSGSAVSVRLIVGWRERERQALSAVRSESWTGKVRRASSVKQSRADRLEVVRLWRVKNAVRLNAAKAARRQAHRVSWLKKKRARYYANLDRERQARRDHARAWRAALRAEGGQELSDYLRKGRESAARAAAIRVLDPEAHAEFLQARRDRAKGIGTVRGRPGALVRQLAAAVPELSADGGQKRRLTAKSPVGRGRRSDSASLEPPGSTISA